MITKKNYFVHRLLQKTITFPSLPAVVTRIIEVTSQPKASLDELKKIIEADSSLVLEILKWANSPLFGLRREVSTLEYAIQLLGMVEIKNMILAKTLFQNFRTVKGFDIFSLWRHSYYCGLAARITAELFTPQEDINEYFCAGLIHDIGKLVIYLELDEEDIKTLEYNRPINPCIIQDEEVMMGIGHDRLGMYLLKKWTFPQKLINAVGYHHHPNLAEEDTKFPLVVHLADVVSHIYDADLTGDKATRTALENIVLNPSTLELAKKYGIIFNNSNLEIILGKLRSAVKLESEIISLLSAKEIGNTL